MGVEAADFVFVMGIRCATRYARLENGWTRRIAIEWAGGMQTTTPTRHRRRRQPVTIGPRLRLPRPGPPTIRYRGFMLLREAELSGTGVPGWYN
uniref:Uncharacterized protein n=1 Tax=Hyaloperonospora arabidopsidis (strain Emoy2) TaxID=559515 RepID=M4BEH2_HYAAE